MEEYNQLEYGMTYEEVCAIIGGPGKFFDEDNPAVGPGKVYFWFGSIDPASNVCCKFGDGVLVDKAESHLQ
jgi:hypothetical protein